MIHDHFRFALRGVRRDPLYAAAVVGTLALTLGASTAVFSIVNGVLLRPLAYPHPEQLVSIREIVPKWANQYPTRPASARNLEERRPRARAVPSPAALAGGTPGGWGGGEPSQAHIRRASGTVF